MKYLTFLAYLLIFLILPLDVFANTSPTPASPNPSQSITQDISANSQRMEYTLLSLMHTVTCIATEKPLLNKPCFSFQPLGSLQFKDQGQTTGGLLGIATGLIATIYSNPPIHAQQYIADISSSFGIVPKAEAQVGGAGGQVILTVYPLWLVSRNFAYVLMTVIFIVVGVMVMFRQRINPQTVITLQAALPGLVVGLILITLSYFFAAILVDIGFAAVYIVGFYFMQTQPVGTPNNIQTLVQSNVLSVFSFFVNAVHNVDFQPAIEAVLQSIRGSAESTLDWLVRFIACEYSEAIGSVASGIPIVGPFAQVAGCLGFAETAVVNKGYFMSLIAWLALFFILLYTMIQVIRKLLMNYITILFLTLTAPFHFLIASLPGQQGVATTWARNMLCNVLAFPGVFAVFYFSAFILSTGNTDIQLAFSIVSGPQPISQTLPLFSGLDSELIRYMIGFGALLVTPGIPDIICDAIGKVGRSSQIIAGQVEGNIKAGQGQAKQGIGFGKTVFGGAAKGVGGFFK